MLLLYCLIAYLLLFEDVNNKTDSLQAGWTNDLSHTPSLSRNERRESQLSHTNTCGNDPFRFINTHLADEEQLAHVGSGKTSVEAKSLFVILSIRTKTRLHPVQLLPPSARV